ncbi:uncharacterized protein LOC143633344 [Bidens hawaiensis]|uniref:uncharacterized protein LOC143633344 n=1 Tax=Bidens hawaiensis TaxID=980011 RepID=UPI00404A84CA
MESFESVFDEWESLSRMFSCDQDYEHFSGHGLFSSEQDHGLNFETPSIVSSVITESINANTSFINDHSFCYANDEINNNSSLLAQLFSDDPIEDILCLTQNNNSENSVIPSVQIMPNQPKHIPANKRIKTPEDQFNHEKLDENPKKKTRKNKKQKMTNASDNTPIVSSSSCSSDDDSNRGTVNSNWKTRACRGAATDPQSLYARKRRERINERLKVLQNLVPNGTKVDISTMLEEAVQYVKFLQLQIKLLSSDEMWMYAPIAYNGMDMGLYQKLSRS